MRIKNAKFSIRDRFSSGGKVIEFCKAMHSSFILMFTAKSLKFKPKSYLNGFTMIEMLIALGLFAVVVSVGIGGFAHALRIQRQTQFLLAVNSNGGEILEQMSREIRTGSIFYILPPPTSGLLFRNANIEDVRYYLDGGMIKRGTTDKSAARTLPPDPMDAPTELLPLNSNIVTIDYLIFDSLTNLLVYESKAPVAKFVASLVNKIKESKTKAVFYALSIKEQEALIKE